MLFCTMATSVAWQPVWPQPCLAARRSPGFTKRMYSADSWLSVAKLRSGLADVFHRSCRRGRTWACRLAASYGAEPAVASASLTTSPRLPLIPFGCARPGAGAYSVGQGELQECRLQCVVGERLLLLEAVRAEPERFLRVHVAQATPGLQRGRSGGDDHVVDEKRAPARPDAPVDADVLADVR